LGIGREQVEHVAKLARLALSEEELDTFEEQLSRILEHARTVTSLDTEGVEPTSHSMPLVNVMRPDEVVEPIGSDAALANAPFAEQGHFRVPRILDEEG
jgi:aspartyl-tRNA(Asn)/glutamyl-tRNA(Gln) amidotransferase subunit C